MNYILNLTMSRSMYLALLVLVLSFPADSQSQTCTPVITSGLAAYYPFCGNANDVSGNGNNGTATGAILTMDRFGNTNSAYSFNGTSDYIALPSGNATSLDITGDFTYSFWLKTTQGSNHIIALGDNILSNSGGYLCGLNDGSAQYGKLGFATQGVWNSSTTSLDNNVWHNVTVTLKADSTRLYIDNVLDCMFTGTPAPLSWNGTRALGCRNDFFNGFYQGTLDDIYIFNRALSPAEVGLLYNPLSTSTVEISAEKQIIVYPNPTSSFLKIQSEKTIYRVEILDIHGRFIKSILFKGDVDVSDLEEGYYFIKAYGSEGELHNTTSFVKF